jgi:hypothetical protein
LALRAFPPRGSNSRLGPPGALIALPALPPRAAPRRRWRRAACPGAGST